MRTSLLLTAGLMACQDAPATLSDFSLTDQNETSATYGQAISPSDYRGMATAWYFGHAT